MFTGDVLLAGQAERLIEKEGPGVLFSAVRGALRGADLTVGNLECALATGGQAVEKKHTFRADPRTAAALAEAGFDLMTLANNHAADYGPEALLETGATLVKFGILPVGAGANAEEARRWAVVEVGSPPVRVALLAFSNMLPASFYASRERPGTNPARPSAIADDVAAAREQADVVVVLFHWGTELSSSPSEVQQRLAAVAADAGADLVVGHHPHVLQGLGMRGRTLIAYSLGNFLFPSAAGTRRTMILRYSPAVGSGAAPDGRARAEVIPCVIEGFRPRPASEGERTEILKRLAILSGPLGAAVHVEDGTVVVLSDESRHGDGRTAPTRGVVGNGPHSGAGRLDPLTSATASPRIFPSGN